MEKITLAAEPRTQLGKKVKELRASGFIPAVLYGKDKKPINLQIDSKKFKTVFDKAGSSALVDLEIAKPASRLASISRSGQGGEKPVKVLIQDIQEDPITNLPIHIDFYAIQMDKELTTEIPLEFIGVSLAVKDLEGSLIKNYDEVEVECLPADLIAEIKVDISSLKTFDDQIKIKDLQVPDKIKLLEEPEEVVALVTPPRSEEELKAMEQEAAADKEKEVVDDMEKKAEEEKATKEAEKEGGADGEKKDVPTPQQNVGGAGSRPEGVGEKATKSDSKDKKK